MQQWRENQSIKNGRFKIEAVLGGGGFGVAYKAQEFSKEGNFQRYVVIKPLNQRQQSREDFDQQQEKFVNEAMTLKGLRHPHIVRVYELIQEEDLWGMVMEFVDGRELAEYIEEKGALPEAEAVKYIKQVGEALGYLHEDGLLHRDIKPHNIILQEKDKKAVLIDFGLARGFTDSRTMSMTNSHTPTYAPIEQYDRHGKFGPYTDIYALAATLYHLLTGEPPFLPAKGRWEAQQQGQSIDSFLWNKIPATVSEGTKEAIVKGMAVLPAERSSSIAEWLNLIDHSQPTIGSKPLNKIEKTIESVERLVDPLSERYGRLLNWQNPPDPFWHYGIGLSDTHIFDTGQGLCPFERNEAKFVLGIDNIAFEPEQTIERMKQALHVFSDWQYNFAGWNCEHLGRLIATDRPRCYQSSILWWMCNMSPEGDHKTAHQIFRDYLMRVNPRLAR